MKGFGLFYVDGNEQFITYLFGGCIKSQKECVDIHVTISIKPVNSPPTRSCVLRQAGIPSPPLFEREGDGPACYRQGMSIAESTELIIMDIITVKTAFDTAPRLSYCLP
jgi:hypothetical protein